MAKIIRTIAMHTVNDEEPKLRTVYLDDGTHFEQVYIKDQGWYPSVEEIKGSGFTLGTAAIIVSVVLTLYIFLNLHVLTVRWAMHSCLPLWMC